MNDYEIKLLENALKLYATAIDLTKEYENDYTTSNAFFVMVQKLSGIIGVELDY